MAYIITGLVYICLVASWRTPPGAAIFRCIEDLLVTFCFCMFFYGRVVVSLTHSPFPFSILLYEQEQTALRCFDIYQFSGNIAKNDLQYFENMWNKIANTVDRRVSTNVVDLFTEKTRIMVSSDICYAFPVLIMIFKKTYFFSIYVTRKFQIEISLHLDRLGIYYVWTGPFH